MLICGLEFNFSALNADDVERMAAAQQHMAAANEAEQKRYTAEGVSFPDVLRSQCKLVMDFLDEVLGAGASERLGLSGNDLGAAQTVCESFKQAITEEKSRFDNKFNAAQPQQLAVTPAKPKAPITLPTAQSTPTVLSAPAPADIPAAVTQAMPGVMNFLKTPAGAKLMAELVAAYAADIHNA